MSFSKTPGPGRETSGKIKPGFDFTYVKPVSKNFGFTLTGLNSNIFNQQYASQPHWSPTSNTGTAGTVATLANPALSVNAPYGNGAWQYGSPWKAYDLYKAHPEYYLHDDVYEIQQNTLN